MKVSTAAFALVALGTAVTLFGSAPASGFALLGSDLPVDLRHYRFFGVFLDATANDNVTPDADFPGVLGGELAVWKGAAEWGSRSHGSGTSDPLQPNLGDGGANFDFYWAGYAASHGLGDSQVVAPVQSCGAGILGFVDFPFAGGWRMKICEAWNWHDGPGGVQGTVFDIDIQTVAAHEFGHALGLGHSAVSNATMYPAYFGTAGRSLHADDIAGVQAIYGAKLATKPEITGLTLAGSVATLTGWNFDATNNEVWFTPAGVSDPAADPVLKVTGIPASAGAQLQVALPAGAGSGAVHVRVPGTAHAVLSNPWPLDLGPNAITVRSITPATVPALVPGTARTMLVTGTNFSSAASVAVTVDGVPVTSLAVSSSTQLSFDMPQVDSLGAVTVSLTQGTSTATAPLTIVAPDSPTLQCGTGDVGNPVSAASGVPLLAAGAVGDLQVVAWSVDPSPSHWPGTLSLDLGNNFTRLFLAGPNQLVAIPAKGWTGFTHPAAGASSGLTVYAQSVRLTGGAPYAVSALQEFVLQ
ncbi:MAG: matrixin family metalloprotease [Planctomycetota bacterium]